MAKVSSWWEVFHSQLSTSSAWIPNVFMYGTTAAFVGFIAKLFGRYILYSVIAIAILIWFMQSFDLVTLNIVRIKAMAGLQSISTVDEAFRFYSLWAKDHIVATISIIMGFGLGWKIAG